MGEVRVRRRSTLEHAYTKGTTLMKNKAIIIIRGNFTNEEFAEIVAVLRQIDTRRPDACLEIGAVDPTGTAMEIGAKALREALPELPGRQTDFSIWRR